MWEHSRSSRNKFLSFYQNDIFKKYNVIIYEKGKEIDLNIPETEFLQDILTGYSIDERNKIVERVTRGVHDSINRGIKGFSLLYGYKKNGREGKHIKWIQVKSEIENVKYCFRKYLEGDSIRSIIVDIYKNKFNGENWSWLTTKWSKILRQFVYTGYNFSIEGQNIFNKYMKFEIESIKELNNKKYYVKSVSFPIQCVSLKDWFYIIEKIHDRKLVYKNKMRKTNSEMLTGIMGCPYCEMRYYLTNDKGFVYYKHYSNPICKQKPKSVRIEKLNKLFEVFFFYFYLVFDDTKHLIEESQRLIKINQLEIKERIKVIETDNKKLEKQIDNFQSIYETSQDIDKLNLILEKEKDLNIKLNKNITLIGKLKNEYEELSIKFDKDKLELTYYDTEETVIKFFEKMNNEEKRTSLIKIINNCQLFGKYIVVHTGKLLFIFNIDNEYILTKEIYKEFRKDKKFKDNFLNSSQVINKYGKLSKNVFKYLDSLPEEKTNKLIQIFENITKPEKLRKLIDKDNLFILSSIINYYDTRILGDLFINEIYLKRNTNEIDVKASMKEKLNSYGIKYDLSDIDKIILFTKM